MDNPTQSSPPPAEAGAPGDDHDQGEIEGGPAPCLVARVSKALDRHEVEQVLRALKLMELEMAVTVVQHCHHARPQNRQTPSPKAA